MQGTNTIFTVEAIQMSDTKKRELIAWCENDDCGEPIYTGDTHIEKVSENGNHYFFHSACVDDKATPDEQLEREEI